MPHKMDEIVSDIALRRKRRKFAALAGLGLVALAVLSLLFRPTDLRKGPPPLVVEATGLPMRPGDAFPAGKPVSLPEGSSLLLESEEGRFLFEGPARFSYDPVGGRNTFLIASGSVLVKVREGRMAFLESQSFRHDLDGSEARLFFDGDGGERVETAARYVASRGSDMGFSHGSC